MKTVGMSQSLPNIHAVAMSPENIFFLSCIAFLSLCLLGLEIQIILKCKITTTTIGINASCLNDGFKTIILPDETIIKYYIAEINTYNISQDICYNHTATLWQVLNQAEWSALMNEMELELKSKSFWIEGKMSETNTCESGSICRNVTEVKEGRGLLVQWNDRQHSTYSRLYRSQTSEKKCLIVEDNADRFWTVGYCELEQHTTVCVKRNC